MGVSPGKLLSLNNKQAFGGRLTGKSKLNAGTRLVLPEAETTMCNMLAIDGETKHTALPRVSTALETKNTAFALCFHCLRG